MLLELESTSKKTEFKKPIEAGAVCYKSYTKLTFFKAKHLVRIKMN